MISKLSRILFLVLISFSIHTSFAGSDVSEKQIKIALRHIGHDILLNAGDSNSLVLPIEKSILNYTIRFQTEFHFLPGEIASIIKSNFEHYKITDGYYVEIEDCHTNTIIHSYQYINNLDSNNMACQKRFQSKGCYLIHIGFVNQEEPTNYLTQFLIGLFILGLLLFLYFFTSQKKETPPQLKPNQISIGEYLFDTIKMTLIYKGDIIELSSKETDLLSVLFKHKNEVVPRETILQLVWGDEGDYVGRTLDVFISKLRKKLAADSTIKIVNIRGIGYKLIH